MRRWRLREESLILLELLFATGDYVVRSVVSFRRWQMSWRVECSFATPFFDTETRTLSTSIHLLYEREWERERGAFEVLTFFLITVGGNRLDTTHETCPFTLLSDSSSSSWRECFYFHATDVCSATLVSFLSLCLQLSTWLSWPADT